MGINPTAPGVAHHALITDLHAVLDRYESMPAIERVAVLAQLTGQVIVQVPTNEFDSADLMRSVAMNIAAGNANAGRTLETMGAAGHG